MNTNLLFIILLITIIIFIAKQNIYLFLGILGVIIVYCWYIPRFTSPRDFLNKLTNNVTELFSPCSSNNPAYCESKNSDWTFLPEIMRSGENKIKTESNDVFLANRLNPNSRLGTLTSNNVSMSSIMNNVQILTEFKVFLDKVTTFIINLPSDDKIQKEFLINKIQNKMAQVMLTANIAVTDMTLPQNNYNELLFAERDLESTLDIIGFLTQDYEINNKLKELQNEWSNLTLKLNKFIINKVNDISPEDYNILSGRLPDVNEPLPANSINLDYK